MHRLFVLTLLPPLLLLVLLTVVFGSYSWNSYLRELSQEEQIVLAPGAREIERVIARRISEARTLAGLSTLLDYLERPSAASRLLATTDLALFVRNSRIYGQITCVDNSAMEQIRIDLTPLGAEAAPVAALQSRADRYYIKGTSELLPGQVYFSRLDLKTRNGKVVEPHQPVIRMVTPLVDRAGGRKGLLILYYQGDDLLQRLGRGLAHRVSQHYLLNAEGFWLDAPDKDRAWGFMLNRPELTMAVQHPSAWQRIRHSESGQFRDRDGLWTFSTATPLNKSIYYATPEKHIWKLVSHVPSDQIEQALRNRLLPVLLISGMLTLLVVGVSWQLARARYWRQLREQEAATDRRRLQMLAELYDNKNMSEQQLFDYALQSVVELTSSKLGYIYFYNEETRLFTLHAWSREVMDSCRVAQPETTYELEKTGIWGEAIRQRKPILINDFAASDPLKKGYPDGHVTLKRFLTIPVLDADRIVAVVGVANKRQPYGDVDIEQLSMFMQGVLSITLRRRLEREQQRLLLLLEESLNEIYLFAADTLKFTYVNRAGQQNLGYQMAELADMTAYAIKPLIAEAAFREMLQPLLAGSRNKLEFSTVHQRKDGTRYPVEVHLQLITIEGNRSFLAVIFDISERLHLEEQLRHAQKMESVGQLASGVAHDFNNIMQIISGNAQLLQLQQRAANCAIPEQLQDILTAVGRGVELTSNLLTFSSRRNLAQVLLDLNRVVQESESLARRLLPHQHTLQVVLCSEPLQVLADPTLLQQALFNLVTNARDAMTDGGTITVETSWHRYTEDEVRRTGLGATGVYAVLQVRDTGKGISDELRQRIFEPFFTTKEVGKGTGLGLPQIYGTIKQHGGFILLESAPGSGTVFSLYLPLAVQPC